MRDRSSERINHLSTESAGFKMSARKSKVVKSVEPSAQYGSKYVAGALDNLIAQKLNRCKYPKAVSFISWSFLELANHSLTSMV